MGELKKNAVIFIYMAPLHVSSVTSRTRNEIEIAIFVSCSNWQGIHSKHSTIHLECVIKVAYTSGYRKYHNDI